MPKSQNSRALMTCFVGVALLVEGLSELASAENWPGWRGPNRNGVSSETGIPTKWSGTENVLWKTPLTGSGISNPVVWGERVIVTASDGLNLTNLHVICLSLRDGADGNDRITQSLGIEAS